MTSEFRAPAWRVWVLAAAFATCAAVVLGRLYSYQVLDHEHLRGLADDEQAQDIEIHPKRGALLDAGRRPLAISVMYDNLYVYGPLVKDAARTAAALAPVVEMPERDVLAKIDRDRRVPVLVKGRLAAEDSARVTALKLPGLYL